MKILLVSATRTEILPLIKKFREISGKGTLTSYRFGSHSIDILITGIGMTRTAFYLGKTLNKKYDLAINAGISGSFRKNIPLGSVVNVASDCFSEFGAEDGNEFLIADKIGIGKTGIRYQVSGIRKISKAISMMKKVKGITVNTVHGNNESIRKVIKKFNPDIETMEGAAFFFACNEEKTSCLQIRSISNYVERRNKKNWKINLAIERLNVALEQLIRSV